MLRIKFIILAIHCKWYQLIWDGNFKIVKVFFRLGSHYNSFLFSSENKKPRY